jgi:hypothetical protein
MMRRQLALWIVLIAAMSVSAQVPNTLWTRTYGGDGYEYPGWIEPAHDSGYVIAGYTNSFGAGEDDMYVVKINPDGERVWAYPYGREGFENAYDIKRTRDGCYIVAGWTDSNPGFHRKFELLKITASGEFIWRRDYGPDSSTNYGFGVCQVQDGGFILVGEVYYYGIYGYDWDTYIIKTDENGNVLNEYQINKNNTQYCFRVIATQDGGAMAVRGTGSFWIAKLDAMGDTVWTRGYGGVSDCNSIIQLADGGYAAFGNRDRGYGIEDQFWLIRLDSEGDVIWDRYYGGTDPDQGYCVQQTYDKGFIMVGHMYPEGQPYDISVIRADSLGNQLWSTHFGGPNSDFGCAIQCTPDSGYVVLGRTPDSTGTLYDFYVARLGTDTLFDTGIDPDPKPLPKTVTLSQNYPNPFNASTVIEYSLPSQTMVSIYIFDILGRKVETLGNSIQEAGHHSIVWNGQDKPSGIYFYRLKAGDYCETRKMLLLK